MIPMLKTTGLSLPWESPFLGKAVVILRRDPEGYRPRGKGFRHRLFIYSSVIPPAWMAGLAVVVMMPRWLPTMHLWRLWTTGKNWPIGKHENGISFKCIFRNEICRIVIEISPTCIVRQRRHRRLILEFHWTSIYRRPDQCYFEWSIGVCGDIKIVFNFRNSMCPMSFWCCCMQKQMFIAVICCRI